MRPSFADDLAETRAHAWRQLARGVRDRRSPFHTPTVATIGLDGRPRLRTVVLRGVDATGGRVRFHTDARADKVAELAADPRIALHAYDPSGKFQVRLEGRAVLHDTDRVGEEAWLASRVQSRACYATMPAPGSTIELPDAFALPRDEAEIAAGRPNFVAVEIVVETLETLYLLHDGHRRARFRLGDGQGTEATWLVP